MREQTEKRQRTFLKRQLEGRGKRKQAKRQRRVKIKKERRKNTVANVKQSVSLAAPHMGARKQSDWTISCALTRFSLNATMVLLIINPPEDYCQPGFS